MRIACPSCAVEYEVPATRLTPGKMVRCAQCGGEWVPHQEVEAVRQRVEPVVIAEEPVATADESVLPPVQPLPPVTAMDRLAARPPVPVRRSGLIAAWTVTLIVLIAAIMAALVWRQAVVRAWPPSSRILGAGDAVPAGPTPPAGKSAE